MMSSSNSNLDSTEFLSNCDWTWNASRIYMESYIYIYVSGNRTMLSLFRIVKQWFSLDVLSKDAVEHIFIAIQMELYMDVKSL